MTRRTVVSPTYPLDGVKVLDFSRHLAGPYATMTLGDFGADVVKVESLPNGDQSRQLRSRNEDQGRESSVYLNWNHGKRSIAIDLHDPAGVAIAQRLARDADVVVENYRPGVADAIGIGYEQLAANNPGLVYCSVSAFGQDGPWGEQPATDPVVQAMSGVMYVTGHANDPVRVGVPISDVVGAMACVQGVLFGLLARDRTGRGQWVDVSLLHALMLSHTTRLGEYYATGEEPQGHGTAHSLVVPYQLFETADGHVIAGAWAQDSWPRFCRAIERTDLIDDPRFATNVDRVANRDELIVLITAEMKRRSTQEWQERFHEHRALFGPMLPISQALEHELMADRPAVVSLPHPQHGSVSVPNPASAIRMSHTPASASLRPPLLGEHTVQILEDAGWSTEEIQRLLADGVVAVSKAATHASVPA